MTAQKTKKEFFSHEKMDAGWTEKRGEGMSHYRRLISYIYAYEGSVKGKNIGYAKIEIRDGQCRIQANVKHVYVGGGEIGVYLLTPGEELLLGRIFIRNGAGEYRTQVNPDNIDGSGCRIDQCYGLTIHDVENAWQCWTTIWEDAVAQTAELELADVTAENQRKIDAEQKNAIWVEENQSEENRIEVKKREPKPEVDSAQKEEENDAVETDSETRDIPDQEDQKYVDQKYVDQKYVDQKDIDQKDAVDQSSESLENQEVSEDQNQQNPVDQERDVADEELPISSEIERELIAEEVRQNEVAPWGEKNETRTVLSEENLKKENLKKENLKREDFGKEDFKKEEQSAVQANSVQNTLGQVDTVARLMAGIRTAISGNGTASGLLSSAIRTVQNVAMENNFGNDISNEIDAEFPQSETPKSESKKPEKKVLEEKLKERWNETKKNIPQKDADSSKAQKNDDDRKKGERKRAETEPFPELENSDFLRELDRLERENNGADHLWKQLQHRYVRVLAFDYEKGCEILSIRPQDIGLLPREIWHYGNNSFLLHGYYNYRHLILARMNNPQGPYRYLLGVPGHYFSNEKYLASMFGFPHFVLARKQPDQDGRFGYWYTEIRL